MSKPVTITRALAGGIHTPTISPHLLIALSEIATTAIEATEAGASIIHLHVRDPEIGKPDPRPSFLKTPSGTGPCTVGEFETTTEEAIDLASLNDDEFVEQMRDDLYEGLCDEIVEGTEIPLDRGWEPYRVLTTALVEAMRIVGNDLRDGIPSPAAGTGGSDRHRMAPLIASRPILIL